MKKIVVTGGLGYIGMEISKLYSGTSRINSITVIDNTSFGESKSIKEMGNKLSTD